jgi:acyl carrier protein
MTTYEEILPKLLPILKDNWPATVATTEDLDANFYDLGLDSLDVSSLVLAVEENFSVIISDEQLEEISSINDIVRFLQKDRS